VSNTTELQRSASQRLSAELAITVGGIITSVATVALNFALTNLLDFDFLTFSFWLVVPAGAIVGGMAAASGYYAAARLTHALPTRGILWNMVGIAISTWMLSKWIIYATLTLDDGRRIADIVSFWEYFKAATESMQLTIGTSGNADALTTGQLGAWGYVREALQVLGFMAGGFYVYKLLKDVEACETCQRYAQTKTVLASASADVFDDTLEQAGITLPNFADQVHKALDQKPLVGLNLVACRCENCRDEWLRPAVVYRSGSDNLINKLVRYDIGAQVGDVLRAYTPPAR
jgi:hypothetical protein